MERIDITTPSGAPEWVELRDPAEVPERLRRRVLAKGPKGAELFVRIGELDGDENAAAMALSEDDLLFMREFDDTVALCFIAAWSFPHPVDADGLGELPGPVYDQIVTRTRPLVPELMPSFTVDGAMDPKAATGSS